MLWPWDGSYCAIGLGGSVVSCSDGCCRFSPGWPCLAKMLCSSGVYWSDEDDPGLLFWVRPWPHLFQCCSPSNASLAMYRCSGGVRALGLGDAVIGRVLVAARGRTVVSLKCAWLGCRFSDAVGRRVRSGGAGWIVSFPALWYDRGTPVSGSVPGVRRLRYCSGIQVGSLFPLYQ